VAGLLAALLLGLSASTRSHFLGLFVVGALLLVVAPPSVDDGWSGSRARWLPLLAAPLVTVGLAALTRDPSPDAGGIARAAWRLSELPHLVPNSLAFFIHWVLAIPLGLPWVAMRWRSLVRRPWVFIVATGAAAWGMHAGFPEYPIVYALVAVAGLGAAAVFDVLADALARRDGLQIVLGIWLLAPLAAAPYVHLPSKYLLLAAPAACVLVSRLAVRTPRLAKPVLAVTLLLGLSLGIAILRADAAAAGTERTAIRTLVAPRIAEGKRVWYLGRWGFKWYAEQAGAHVFSLLPPYPTPGDFLASTFTTHPLLSAFGEQTHTLLVHVGRVEYSEPGGRIMDASLGAGFYSNYWGYLPWAWGAE